MAAEASVKYCLPEGFEETIKTVCGALRDQGVRIAGYLDVSGWLRRALGIAVPQCRILFVLPGARSLPSAPIHPWTGIFLPLHVVVSGDGSQSEVLIQNRIDSGSGVGAISPEEPVADLQAQVFKALQSIATRSSILA